MLDTPEVAAGTVLRYKLYVGSWGGFNIWVGGMDNGQNEKNENGNAAEILVLREIAVAPK